MRRAVFLEDRAQVSASAGLVAKDTHLIALTAEALQALEERGLPHQPVSAYADTRLLSAADEQLNIDLGSLLSEIESFIAERYSPARLDGPGFLSGQAYPISGAAVATATRAFLMRESVRRLSPGVVTIFAHPIDPLFAGSGYSQNPWNGVLAELSGAFGFELETLPQQAQRGHAASVATSLHWLRHGAERRARRTLRAVIDVAHGLGRAPGDRLRLLLVNPGYDWLPVLGALARTASGQLFRLNGRFLLPDQDWTFSLDNSMSRLWLPGQVEQLTSERPTADDGERKELGAHFDAWLAQCEPRAKLNVVGLDLMPALAPYLRHVVELSPAIARHADIVARHALEAAHPDAVCLVTTSVAGQRLAFQARSRDVPVVSYQHGGSYGTHRWTPHQLGEWRDADYFLSYGPGIRPPDSPAFPIRARFVPVGSTRIDAWRGSSRRARPSGGRVTGVLWIAETTTRNLAGVNLAEDTERYLLERECLEILQQAEKKFEVVYRPYPWQEYTNGVVQWLVDTESPRVRVDHATSLASLIRAADIVITDAASGTVWNEVIWRGTPLVVFCDPLQTRLTDEFATDLGRACRWCTSGEELRSVVREITRGEYAPGPQGDGREVFLARYVLNEGDCVQRVIDFLEALRVEARAARKRSE